MSKGADIYGGPERSNTEPATTVAEVTAETKACDCNETIKESTESICVVKENEMQVTVFLITSFICLLRVVYCSYSSLALCFISFYFILLYIFFVFCRIFLSACVFVLSCSVFDLSGLLYIFLIRSERKFVEGSESEESWHEERKLKATSFKVECFKH